MKSEATDAVRADIDLVVTPPRDRPIADIDPTAAGVGVDVRADACPRARPRTARAATGAADTNGAGLATVEAVAESVETGLVAAAGARPPLFVLCCLAGGEVGGEVLMILN